MPNHYPYLKPVDSSMFSRAGFDEDTWNLVFEFKSTKEIRAYHHCSPEVAEECLTSESIGKWFNANIRGNTVWEHTVLGAEHPAEPIIVAERPIPEGGITDSDIRLVEPGWNGKTIDPVLPKKPVVDDGWPPLPEVPKQALDVLQEARAAADVVSGADPKFMHMTEVADWPKDFPNDFGVEQFDPQTGHRPNSDMNEDMTVKESAMAAQPQGELLGAWTAPETAAEALDMLAEREGEIKAIIAQNVQTCEQALTVKITDGNTRLTASDTLNKLATKRETTVKALDPFRKVIYEAYSEAQQKVKAGVDPLEKGINFIKNAILAWDRKQEEARQAEIRKENERREAEAKRLQEEEAARIKLADVTDALEAGDTQRAETLFDMQVEVPRPYVAPVYIPPAAPKIEGQSKSTTWKVDRDAIEFDDTGQAYVASITKLLRAVKDGSYPIEQAAQLLAWDFAAADKLAGAMMSAFNVPGLTAGPKDTLRVGGRKKK